MVSNLPNISIEVSLPISIDVSVDIEDRRLGAYRLALIPSFQSSWDVWTFRDITLCDVPHNLPHIVQQRQDRHHQMKPAGDELLQFSCPCFGHHYPRPAPVAWTTSFASFETLASLVTWSGTVILFVTSTTLFAINRAGLGTSRMGCKPPQL